MGVYSDSSCSTPMGWCDSFSDKRCRLSMDECHAGGPDGKMKKHVEKNNKIYEQVWSNSATCSGAPTTETEELGGATVSSANCTRRDSAWYKDLTIEQVPANQCAVLRFFSGTACDQPLGSGIGSTCSNKVMGANPVCGPVSSGFKTQPNVPGSAVSLLRICKNKKDLILLDVQHTLWTIGKILVAKLVKSMESSDNALSNAKTPRIQPLSTVWHPPQTQLRENRGSFLQC